jgi:hypothetical protein
MNQGCIVANPSVFASIVTDFRVFRTVYGIDDAKTQGLRVLRWALWVIQGAPAAPEDRKPILGGPKMMLLQSRFGRFAASLKEQRT